MRKVSAERTPIQSGMAVMETVEQCGCLVNVYISTPQCLDRGSEAFQSHFILD